MPYVKASVLLLMKGNANSYQTADKGMNTLIAMGTILLADVFGKHQQPLSHRCPGMLVRKAKTPVSLTRMLPWLDRYSDCTMVHLLINGFKEGFLVPLFSKKGCTLVKNLHSAVIHPEIVQDKISKEVVEGRVSCPFLRPPFPNFRLSPLGIVPKKEQGSFRLIHHLSYTVDASLNDEVSDVEAPVSYSSLD